MGIKDFSGSDFYVYEHRRSSDGLPFYVGKGRGKRAWAKSGRSEWWKNVSDKHGVDVIIIRDRMTNSCSITLEKITIAAHLSKGYPLVNLTSGGDGAPGSVRSDESRIAGSRSQGGRAVLSSDGMRFETAVLAAEWLKENGWPKASRVNISRTCLGKVGSAYGRSWWYEGDDQKEYVDKRVRLSERRGRAILRSNGKRFDSLKMAGEYMHSIGYGKHAEHRIWRACKGIVNKVYGFEWRYATDDTPNH